MAPGIDPARMTLWEYTARLWTWNDRARRDAGEDPDISLPSPEAVRAAFARIPAAALGSMQ
jgi:hypothetical protein